MEDTTIDIAVANPFRILSAYFMTVATTSPPNAYTQYNKQVINREI